MTVSSPSWYVGRRLKADGGREDMLGTCMRTAAVCVMSREIGGSSAIMRTLCMSYTRTLATESDAIHDMFCCCNALRLKTPPLLYSKLFALCLIHALAAYRDSISYN